MEHDLSMSSERERVSNFVRQRIAALNTARWKMGRQPLLDANGGMIVCEDTCTLNGVCQSWSPATVLVESVTEKDILADEELQHMGCPICIACFAGMQPTEQVQRTFSVFMLYFMGFWCTFC